MNKKAVSEIMLLLFTIILTSAFNIQLVKAEIIAIVDIDPDTLNLKSEGKWVTGYIELPEGYDVSDIDVYTIILDDTISAELKPAGIGDEDDDGIPDLIVKFSRREAICCILKATDFSESTRFIDVSLTITGELTDGTPFEGSDTIRIIIPKQMSSMSQHIQI